MLYISCYPRHLLTAKLLILLSLNSRYILKTKLRTNRKSIRKTKLEPKVFQFVQLADSKQGT